MDCSESSNWHSSSRSFTRRETNRMNRHEIPTHLNVEDKAFAGLTMRQLMTAAVGLGFYKDFQEVEKVIRLTGAEFTPNPDFRDLYDKAYANFCSLYPPFSAIGKGKVAVE